MHLLEGSVFVLSGEELTLPPAEVNALVKTYSSATCEQISRRVVLSNLSDTGKVSQITARAAYVRFGGMLVSLTQNIGELTKDLPCSIVPRGKSFAVASESMHRLDYGEIGAKIKRATDSKVCLENPDYLFQAEKLENDKYVLGVSLAGIKRFSWRERRPRARRFFLPSAIYPKLARVLVNLSRVKEGQYFLDPFCGTGSLLIEASVMGIKTIGIDLTRWIARGAVLNMNGLSLEYESIIRGDSTSCLPFRQVEAMATDVPYGRASSTKGKDTLQITKEFVKSAALLNSDKYCVLMHPSNVELELDNIFELSEQHLLYVHRNLTRAISVLRRR